MTTPTTSPRYASEAIQQTITENLGNHRTIPTGSFVNWGDYEGRDPKETVVNSLIAAQVTITPGPTTLTVKNFPATGDRVLYDVEYRVTLTYKTDDPGLFSDDDRKRQAYDSFATDSHAIISALTFPHNLDTTTTGTPTGLISGMLALKSQNAPEANFGERWMRGVLEFTGKILATR